ncbi:hypothetical protein WAI453_008489 [Rhynchosporium graminicola]
MRSERGLELRTGEEWERSREEGTNAKRLWPVQERQREGMGAAGIFRRKEEEEQEEEEEEEEEQDRG